MLTMMAMTSVWAQTDELKDLIYTADNKVIEAKVTEVSSEEIKYKDWNNQMGPTFILSKGEVNKVEFSNGTVKTFAGAAAQPAAQPAATAAPVAKAEQKAATPAAAKPQLPVGFQFNLDVEGNLCFVSGYYLNNCHVKNYACGGVNVNVGAGARVGKFLYIGAAAGALGEWGDPYVELNNATHDEKKAHASAWIIPIFADVRVYAPTHGNCYPYAEVGIGGYIGIDGQVKFEGEKISNKPQDGFYFISGVGMEFKRVNIGAGYKLMRDKDAIGNHGYVKLGISLGRPQKLRQ